MRKLLAMIIMLLCYSTNLACQDIKEKVYCCDSAINKAVIDNLPNIRQMDRSQWLKLREDFKIPVYRAFTPEQKHELWKGKFVEVKQLPWTKAERKHINKAIKWVETHPFLWSDRKSTDKELNEMDLFFTKWTIEAEEKLNWDKRVAIALFQTPDRMLDTKGTLEITKTGLILKPINKASIEEAELEVDTADIETPSDTTDITETEEELFCSCHEGSIVTLCFPLSCERGWMPCKVTEKGCGLWWNQECNGLCN